MGLQADRIAQLTSYITSKSTDDHRFDGTKLARLICRVDFSAYIALGSPITCAAYYHATDGPALRPVSGDQDEAPPLTADQLAIVDGVIAENLEKTGEQMSEEARALTGWRLSKDGEDIPYFTALLEGAPEALTEEELAHARELARRR